MPGHYTRNPTTNDYTENRTTAKVLMICKIPTTIQKRYDYRDPKNLEKSKDFPNILDLQEYVTVDYRM